MEERIIEERKEICSVVSKMVSLEIYRLKPLEGQGEGEIVGFNCHNSTQQCESRCTYRLLLEDY
ncbi:MAG: hypothetical protein Q8912_08310 [Bacillota bacterium]|nr:hypothetical protein [Bacillota bacterium]MDP4159070.1 hypothetical protein [Bacillota bacterium]